jgi:hypothetical protein
MRLAGKVHCRTDLATAWAFFADPRNLARWDRSVAQVVMTRETPNGLGTAFDTIGPARAGKQGLKTSYEVVLIDEPRRADVEVTHSNLFSFARWRTELVPDAVGVWVICEIDCHLKGPWRAITPVLALTKGAILRDLGYLKDALEQVPLAA